MQIGRLGVHWQEEHDRTGPASAAADADVVDGSDGMCTEPLSSAASAAAVQFAHANTASAVAAARATVGVAVGVAAVAVAYISWLERRCRAVWASFVQSGVGIRGAHRDQE